MGRGVFGEKHMGELRKSEHHVFLLLENWCWNMNEARYWNMMDWRLTIYPTRWACNPIDFCQFQFRWSDDKLRISLWSFHLIAWSGTVVFVGSFTSLLFFSYQRFLVNYCISMRVLFWLVVSNIFYFPFHIWDVILPIDELHYFSRWAHCTTNQYWLVSVFNFWQVPFLTPPSFHRFFTSHGVPETIWFRNRAQATRTGSLLRGS